MSSVARAAVPACIFSNTNLITRYTENGKILAKKAFNVSYLIKLLMI